MQWQFWTKLSLIFLLAGNFDLMAQDEVEPTPVPGGASDSSKVPDKNEMAPPKLPKSQEFSSAEVQKECRKYEGKYIAYFDQIYKVEKCKRRELIQADDDANPAINGVKVVSVDGMTIAKIPEGTAYGSEKPLPKANCLRLEGRYILSRGDDIYFIEKCKKRFIPDWDTYVEHSKKQGKRGLEVFELADSEFQTIKPGVEIKSVLDEEYKRLLDADKNADIIPINEACKGLNGKFVSYYSKIYRIDACRKRPVDVEAFVAKLSSYKMIELSSEQWVSLPTGNVYKP